MKKFLLFILMLVPFAVQAEEVLIGDCYYNLDDDAEVATVSRISKNSSASSITIPSQVPKTYSTGYKFNFKVVGIENNAFANANITSVTLPNSLKSIGDEAFAGCTSLTSIAIPESVTSMGKRVFRSCIYEA